MAVGLHLPGAEPVRRRRKRSDVSRSTFAHGHILASGGHPQLRAGIPPGEYDEATRGRGAA
jgi:hypothetical protein